MAAPLLLQLLVAMLPRPPLCIVACCWAQLVTQQHLQAYRTFVYLGIGLHSMCPWVQALLRGAVPSWWPT